MSEITLDPATQRIELPVHLELNCSHVAAFVLVEDIEAAGFRRVETDEMGRTKYERQMVELRAKLEKAEAERDRARQRHENCTIIADSEIARLQAQLADVATRQLSAALITAADALELHVGDEYSKEAVLRAISQTPLVTAEAGRPDAHWCEKCGRPVDGCVCIVPPGPPNDINDWMGYTCGLLGMRGGSGEAVAAELFRWTEEEGPSTRCRVLFGHDGPCVAMTARSELEAAQARVTEKQRSIEMSAEQVQRLTEELAESKRRCEELRRIAEERGVWINRAETELAELRKLEHPKAAHERLRAKIVDYLASHRLDASKVTVEHSRRFDYEPPQPEQAKCKCVLMPCENSPNEYLDNTDCPIHGSSGRAGEGKP